MTGKPNVYYFPTIKQNRAREKKNQIFFLILASRVDTVKTHEISMTGSLSLYLRNLMQIVAKERNLRFMSKDQQEQNVSLAPSSATTVDIQNLGFRLREVLPETLRQLSLRIHLLWGGKGFFLFVSSLAMTASNAPWSYQAVRDTPKYSISYFPCHHMKADTGSSGRDIVLPQTLSNTRAQADASMCCSN